MGNERRWGNTDRSRRSAVSRFSISSARPVGPRRVYLAANLSQPIGEIGSLPWIIGKPHDMLASNIAELFHLRRTSRNSLLQVADAPRNGAEVCEGGNCRTTRVLSLPGIERSEIRVLVNLCGLHLLKQELRKVAAFVQKLHDLLNVTESHQLVLQELPTRMNRRE